MNQYYLTAGTTRQAHHAAVRRYLVLEDQWLLLEAVLHEERSKHPAMSLKKLYHRLKPDFVGRDAFVDYGMENGFEPVLIRKKPKTSTDKERVVYPNLLRDLKIFDINQVWITDITYFKIKNVWHYITMIEDLYSRRIIGYTAAENMFAEANIRALQMALKTRNITSFNHILRHHSDRGSQYYSTDYINMLNNAQIQISMGRSCFDNLYMESCNGIIKNEYLIHRNINSLQDLIRHLERDCYLYNNERPHGSLNRMTPLQFECYISNIPIHQRPLLNIFTSKYSKNILLDRQTHNQQLEFNFR